MAAHGPLVDAGWLAAHRGEPDLCLIDVRWYLDGRSGRDAYLAGHLPGAVFVDLERELTGSGGAGRHPLPAEDQFQAAMRRAGVNRSSRVVAYDDQGGFSACRLWWLLRLHGHPAVAVLDGGLDAWAGPRAKGEEVRPAGDFVAAPADRARFLDYEAMQKLPSGIRLVDARAGERYRGEVEPLDPRAGHIPGAVNVPWAANLDADKRFRPADELRRRFAAAGVRSGSETVVYCGSGVSAAVDLLALEVAGLTGARLYAGSWSDWSARPEAPIATGDEPGS